MGKIKVFSLFYKDLEIAKFYEGEEGERDCNVFGKCPEKFSMRKMSFNLALLAYIDSWARHKGTAESFLEYKKASSQYWSFSKLRCIDQKQTS